MDSNTRSCAVRCAAEVKPDGDLPYQLADSSPPLSNQGGVDSSEDEWFGGSFVIFRAGQIWFSRELVIELVFDKRLLGGDDPVSVAWQPPRQTQHQNRPKTGECAP